MAVIEDMVAKRAAEDQERSKQEMRQMMAMSMQATLMADMTSNAVAEASLAAQPVREKVVPQNAAEAAVLRGMRSDAQKVVNEAFDGFMDKIPDDPEELAKMSPEEFEATMEALNEEFQERAAEALQQYEDSATERREMAHLRYIEAAKRAPGMFGADTSYVDMSYGQPEPEF